MFNLGAQIPCGETMRARSHNDDLLETVRGSHRYVAVVADPVNRFLDGLGSRLRLFRINDMHIMVHADLTLVAFYFVGIKDKNQRHFFISLII